MAIAVTAPTAQKNFYKLMADVNANSAPVVITNDNGKNAVLISEDDWNAIQETLYISSIPGMAESIIEAGNEPSEKCSKYNPDEEW